MITKEITLVNKHDNGDGSQTFIAEINVYVDGVFKWQNSRSEFTMGDTMTDQEIKDYLIANEYAAYF